MAGRAPPDDGDRSTLPLRAPLSEPRSQRWAARRYPTSLDTDLSLLTELRRSEEQAEQQSLPNNLGWSSRGSSQSPSSKTGATKKKGKHFEQVKLPSKTSPGSPTSDTNAPFTRKRHHTPATIPRTRLPPGTPSTEIAAMESLRQRLSFDDNKPVHQSPKTRVSRRQNPSSGPANNERPVPTQSRSAASAVTLPLLEMNETETTRPSTDGTSNARGSKVNTTLIISRLNQVRDFLKQASAMLVTLRNTSATDLQSSELNEQTTKISRLIKQLKQQERAYIELLQRTVAVEHDSTMENTPSLSLQSLTEEEKSESASIRDEELQGLRQQHTLLKKMLEQQQQLKELQTRQAALLTLQRDAEMRLAEAEEEGQEIPGELATEGGQDDGTERGAGATATSQASRFDTSAAQTTVMQPSAGVLDDSRFTSEELELMNLLRTHKEKWRSADSGDEKERDERENQRIKRTNQPQAFTANQAMPREVSSAIADNEEAALALANATQERLELENKLMVLEAKKEQMDTLLKELQSLREAQLKKESLEAAVGASSSVNESKLEEDEPLATTSEKLDDERILEALEVHEKLQKLQDVRDRLKQLRDLIGHYQPPTNEADQRTENVPQTHSTSQQLSVPVQSTEDEDPEELEGAVGGAAAINEQDISSIEWMLSAGVEDPDLMGKIRQLQEARARVAHLFKQTNENPQPTSSRVNNEAVRMQITEEESQAESQTDTDAESAGSSSVNAMAWQDDPEFQAKVRKLNSAKQKLKQLQELVKKIQQFPDISPALPAELVELSFDEEDFDEDDDSDEDDDDDNESDNREVVEEREESNRSETSGTNEEDDVQNEGEAVITSGTEDEEAVANSAALNRNRMLDLEGWFLGSDQEAVYQRYLRKQTAELDQLQQERQRLLEVQQELRRLSQQSEPQKTVATQTIQEQPLAFSPRSSFRNDTFTVGRSEDTVAAAAAAVNREISTQTPFYGSDLQAARSVDSSEPSRSAQHARPSALVWSELRRQRELHEEKLKRRKQKFLEKRKKAGLDDLSEGGTYSIRSGRSGDIDEGFGVSMMSADITTATWGGSTQPSSTQNDSAVSADESDEENRGSQIPVEVEDDYPDGIVQAEEEEEERLEPEAFTGGAEAVFRSRERVPRISAFRGSVDRALHPGKKRKIDGTTLQAGGGRKRDRERELTFEDWPRTFYFDRNSRGRIRQENFTPAEQLIKEREQEQFSLERQAWERHCERLHQEVSSLTTLCNGLLRDQQSLVSTVIGRTVPSGASSSPGSFPNIPGLGGNPFEQYQQREQEAYQGLQTFFDQQRYMQQQYQILRSLNQCYAQLQQQHQDMAVLQQQFQQLFSYNPSPAVNQNSASPNRPQTASPNITSHASPMFMNLPSSSSVPPPFSAPLVSQAPFTFPHQPPSSAPMFRTGWQPSNEAVRASEPTENREASESRTTQDPCGVNPDTGIPSPRAGARGGHPVEPAPAPTAMANSVKVVREVGPSTSGLGLSPGNIRPGRKYDPSSYEEVAATGAPASKNESSEEVIGRAFNTPLRASAVANLAQKDKSAQKSAGRRLAHKLAAESVETSSRASSIPGEAQDVARGSWQDADRASEAGSEFSLFEALRDSIYSEVATLISLNESRPHFLLELFRELQLLTSDYLRQRALYALQDLVTRFLTEDSIGTEGAALQQARFQEWLGSNSELTPSETVETFEDDESETREGEVPAPETVTEGIYDYVENVESGSTLSTPTSSHAGDAPFASEGLGDTVIHLDKALSRMREYERLKTEGKLSEVVSSASIRKEKLVKDDVTTSSAGDVGSESSVSDVQYPRIDTQALDHLIKSIMSEVIPYLNEHMEDNCTTELLSYIRNLVLSRIQVDEEQEFGRFFHKQLASILQDSLSRFKDRKMKDVGEDMLVDMSEILFNELAFFRLMQDLDGTRGASRRPAWRQGFDSASTDTGTGQDGDKEDGDETDEKDKQHTENSAVEEEGVEGTNEREEAEGEEEEEVEEESSDEESSSSEESGAEDEGADDEGPEDEEDELDEGDAAAAAAAAAAAMPLSKEQQEAEEEELGKVRDDVMANKFEDKSSNLQDHSSVDSPQCVKLELSASESKPFSSFGSGEEDGEESFDDSDARRKLAEYQGSTAASASVNSERQANNRDGLTDSEEDGAPQDEQHQAVEAAAAAAAAAGLSPYIQNGQVSNGQDDGDVTLDDLPTKLTGLTEADLQARIAEEQSRSEGSSAVLAHLDELPELAGDPEALREPESSERPVNGLHPEEDK
ncbi:pericentriolar material 1 protein-like isoform X2 [Montipora foliosa]|uniref:pericentriolar material 1 protein-like isoform X2 n=1 Tax=Montipora foliosa TaxID=591990 RepID=UPI0035F1A98F